MHDVLGIDRYTWIDGTLVGYSKFRLGYPALLGRRCVFMNANNGSELSWEDGDCEQLNKYICKRPSGRAISIYMYSIVRIKYMSETN